MQDADQAHVWVLPGFESTIMSADDVPWPADKGNVSQGPVRQPCDTLKIPQVHLALDLPVIRVGLMNRARFEHLHVLTQGLMMTLCMSLLHCRQMDSVTLSI